MKLPVFIALFLLVFPLYSQADAAAGEYYLQLGNKNTRLIEYHLTLNADGTFYFHSQAITSDKIGIPEEINEYGQGTWLFQDRRILFFTDPEKDLDEKFNLNFRDSEAHFISKSPRSLSDRPFKTRLKFFESDIFWIKGMEIFKR